MTASVEYQGGASISSIPGGRDRAYAEPGVGRVGESVGVSGRNLSIYPDRTSELGANEVSV
jgi:hypothetical protein